MNWKFKVDCLWLHGLVSLFAWVLGFSNTGSLWRYASTHGRYLRGMINYCWGEWQYWLIDRLTLKLKACVYVPMYGSSTTVSLLWTVDVRITLEDNISLSPPFLNRISLCWIIILMRFSGEDNISRSQPFLNRISWYWFTISYSNSLVLTSLQ